MDGPSADRRLSRNLTLLHAAFGAKRIGDLGSGARIEVDGVELVCAYEPGSTPERFYIVKPPALVARYQELCAAVEGGRVVELGIAEGGSTALIALLARPERLVAFDLEEHRVDALDTLIAERGWGDRVRPHYGVDQADRARLARIVDEELDGRPLDLVIDDCSHQLEPTRASFETLFPRLRPGGLYVIEDWRADHAMREAVAAAIRAEVAAGRHPLRDASPPAEGSDVPADWQPLSRLAIELLLTRAGSGEVVEEVALDEFWLTVRRGPGELDLEGFRLADAYHDHFGLTGW
jgi:predicted O-methyltransferase YrrM